jgi:hypothetical protein
MSEGDRKVAKDATDEAKKIDESIAAAAPTPSSSSETNQWTKLMSLMMQLRKWYM